LTLVAYLSLEHIVTNLLALYLSIPLSQSLALEPLKLETLDFMMNKVTSELHTTEDWLVSYFKSSGEDRQLYINEVERLKGE